VIDDLDVLLLPVEESAVDEGKVQESTDNERDQMMWTGN
jgi:hypothetical protein